MTGFSSSVSTPPTSGFAQNRRRSWLLTFSDVLMQLLAFFILRLAISPNRHPKPPPVQPPMQQVASVESRPMFRDLQILKFRRVGFADSIAAELASSSLPLSSDEVSFTLREELMTLSSTFGGGDYLFSVSELRCPSKTGEPRRQVSAKAALFISELITTGIMPHCLQLGTVEEARSPCESFDEGTVTVTIEQKNCEPF